MNRWKTILQKDRTDTIAWVKKIIIRFIVSEMQQIQLHTTNHWNYDGIELRWLSANKTPFKNSDSLTSYLRQKVKKINFVNQKLPSLFYFVSKQSPQKWYQGLFCFQNDIRSRRMSITCSQPNRQIAVQWTMKTSHVWKLIKNNC